VDLGQLLDRLGSPEDSDLLVGYETSDDAGVYRVREDLALVQTVDLITPVCDDPFRFGQVAAANSLSDVYAMGGAPLTALNVCCFPGDGVPDGVFAEILRGASDKCREAGARIIGGHTVNDRELKYGLAATGTVHPGRVLRNSTARPGDAIVLTKPIGTGLMIGAARKDLLPADRLDLALDRMARLNAAAAALALQHGATACTDVTGFGLAGHVMEVARASGVSVRLRDAAVSRYEEWADLIARGITTVMTPANRKMAAGHIEFAAELDETARTLYFDPQTSGGLLIFLPGEQAGSLVAALRGEGSPEASIVGEVLPRSGPLLRVTPA